MFRYVLLFGVLGLGAPLWAGDEVPTKVERIVIEERGFSIVPPSGWEVVKTEPGLTLFLQVPKTPQLKYQRSIQVRHGKDAVIIDRYGVEQFGQILEANRAKAFGPQANYKIRSSVMINLADGNPGALYYTEFQFNEFPMMEMHILISSPEGHFLLTYTDLAEYFANNNPGSPLDIAYRSIISAQLSQHVGGRFDLWIRLGIGGAGCMIFWFVFRYFRGRKVLQFDEGEVDDDAELSLVKTASGQKQYRHLDADDDDVVLAQTGAQVEKFTADIHRIRSRTSVESEEIRIVEEDDEATSWHEDDDFSDYPKAQ